MSIHTVKSSLNKQAGELSPKVQLNTDGYAMRLLEHATQELLAALARPQVKGLGASAQESSKNAVLRALEAQINAEGKIAQVTQEAIEAVLNSVDAQVNLLKNLKNQINEIQKELNENLSPAQITKLEAQLKEIEQEYEKALYLEQEAQADAQKREKDNQALEKANEKLQKEINETSDPQKKKELENQLHANQKAIKQNSSKIEQDQKVISTQKSTISGLESSVSSLIKNNPELTKELTMILQAMKEGSSIDSCMKEALDALDALEQKDSALTSQLNSLQGEYQTLLSSLKGQQTTAEAVLLQLEKTAKGSHTEVKLLKTLIETLSHIQHVDLQKNTEKKGAEEKGPTDLHYLQQLELKKKGQIA